MRVERAGRKKNGADWEQIPLSHRAPPFRTVPNMTGRSTVAVHAPAVTAVADGQRRPVPCRAAVRE